MNSKVIKSILNKKLNQWVESIKDDKVKQLVKKNTIVTGGSIASMLLGEEYKDIDVYFKDKQTTYLVAQYYAQEFNKAHPDKVKAFVVDGEVDFSNGTLINPTLMREFSHNAGVLRNVTPDRVKILINSVGVVAENEDVLKAPFEDAVQAITDADHIDENALEGVGDKKDPYRAVFLSSNAITLADKIQLIVRFYGDPEKVHESFDFVHCTNYYDYGTKELVLKKEALECLMAKELRYMGSKYPVCSIIRTRKFIKRGFNINAGQYLKMMFQISQLDLTNLDVLDEQLVGVDSAYFSHLINALRTKQESDPTFTVDSTYLGTLIDRIF